MVSHASNTSMPALQLTHGGDGLATGVLATIGGGATGSASATGGATATGDRGLKWVRSMGADDEPTSPESAGMNKARTEREALLVLKQKMVEAQRHGKWVHPPTSISPNSVLHWAGQMVTALEELTRDRPDSTGAV